MWLWTMMKSAANCARSISNTQRWANLKLYVEHHVHPIYFAVVWVENQYMPVNSTVHGKASETCHSTVQVKKVREPHPDIGCWWTLYDYGVDAVKTWDKNYKHPYPGTLSLRDNFLPG